MFYKSTRNEDLQVSPSMAVVKGIAPDGGLYMFSDDIAFDYKTLMGKTFKEMATVILTKLLPDFSEAEMNEMVNGAYDGKFETPEITPTVKVGDEYVLELFRGRTSAFKDVALSMLPYLLTASAKKNGINDDIVILTATSGDTGKAALTGFSDVPGTKIIVFYPDGGVSAVQRKQMATAEGKNVNVLAIKGNFDDAQTGVKNIFSHLSNDELAEKYGCRLSSANSINIGRLAPQVVYYYKAYSDLLQKGVIKPGDKVNFSVPTGNFGDILAGYIAKKMGLPVGRLLVASNANNVLTDFFNTGVYDRNRPFLKTTSPSMDILISSNLERLLYLALGSEKVASLMKSLKDTGKYDIGEEALSALKEEFSAEYLCDSEVEKVIGETYKNYGYLCDTHTAVGVGALRKYREKTGDCGVSVILSTASPYKFSVPVGKSIGMEITDEEFDNMERLSATTGVPVPAGLKGLKGKPDRFSEVIEKEDMEKEVLKLLAEKEW